MSNLKQALQQLPEPTKKIGNMLIEFYETMKALEKDAERGGKQGTKIVMTISDFETFYKQFGKELLDIAADNAKLLPFNGDYDVHEIDKYSITSVLDEYLKKNYE